MTRREALSLIRTVLTLGAGLAAVRIEAQCFIQKLYASQPGKNQAFGYSAAIDAESVVIGAPWVASGVPVFGAAYIFQREGTKLELRQKLESPEPKYYDGFGSSVGLQPSRMVVGARRGKGAWSASGCVYVFETSVNGWTPTAHVYPDSGIVDGQFGTSVGLDGNFLCAGDPYDNPKGTESGSAHVFALIDGEWVQEAELVAADGTVGDRFGSSIAISGTTIIVGSKWSDAPVFGSGAAYVFDRDPNGEWVQTAKLTPADPFNFGSFGISVAIEGDIALIGASGAQTPGFGHGAAYVFRRSGSGIWTQAAKLYKTDNPWGAGFGYYLSLKNDLAVITAFADGGDPNNFTLTGAAYVFRRMADDTWKPVQKLTAPDGTFGDQLGRSVAVSPPLAVVGAWEDDVYGTYSGSAYIFAVGPDVNSNGLMDPCECPGDLNKDWIVDQADLGLLLANWGCTGGLGYEPSQKPCPGALTGCCGDLDADGDVDQADLGVMLQNFGNVCP